MSNRKAILFGTSRLHRPFSKRLQGEVATNKHAHIEIVFPKIGYFHTTAEIVQAIKFLSDPETLPFDLRKYIFRIEPRSTTPLNEFDSELEQCIKLNTEYKSKISFDAIHHIVFEVSSLQVNKHTPSGCILHTNPNFIENVPYSDIYPDGYCKKYASSMPVEKTETTLDDLIAQIVQIKNILPSKNIVILSHLRSERFPNALRDRIYSMTKEACTHTRSTYIDTAPILDIHGFAHNGGAMDIHHLSHEGEIAVSQLIFERLGCPA